MKFGEWLKDHLAAMLLRSANKGNRPYPNDRWEVLTEVEDQINSMSNVDLLDYVDLWMDDRSVE
jgi:hypothetical protein